MMARKKILIVDDEIGIQNLLSRVLKGEGYDVRAAGNGDQALEMAQEDFPDLVLCDIKMPGKDGIEVLAELKKLSSKIEVIMLTAHSTVESAVAAMKLGAADYLPLSLNASVLGLREWVGLGVYEVFGRFRRSGESR